jgi:hypothetical protein
MPGGRNFWRSGLVSPVLDRRRAVNCRSVLSCECANTAHDPGKYGWSKVAQGRVESMPPNSPIMLLGDRNTSCNRDLQIPFLRHETGRGALTEHMGSRLSAL